MTFQFFAYRGWQEGSFIRPNLYKYTGRIGNHGFTAIIIELGAASSGSLAHITTSLVSGPDGRQSLITWPGADFGETPPSRWNAKSARWTVAGGWGVGHFRIWSIPKNDLRPNVHQPLGMTPILPHMHSSWPVCYRKLWYKLWWSKVWWSKVSMFVNSI